MQNRHPNTRHSITPLLQYPYIIKFGTSGWRGIIARDFTFDNVRLATQASRTI